MSSPCATKSVWILLAALALGPALGGCSSSDLYYDKSQGLYYDRRDSIAFGAGDAHATNRVTHMVDPWPAASANRNIAFNGDRMQAAFERYRTGKVTPPVNATTSSVQYQQAQAAAAAAVGGTSAAPAAPVK